MGTTDKMDIHSPTPAPTKKNREVVPPQPKIIKILVNHMGTLQRAMWCMEWQQQVQCCPKYGRLKEHSGGREEVASELCGSSAMGGGEVRQLVLCLCF